ncbi:MAG: hypothetical protein COA86_14870 [Kangiella sp.]|nr:MAG: hypothetical protein COA86_14870 [Kangiella sp.]
MSTKLTLSLNEQTIADAKRWAKSHHTSLSGLVEKYFQSLTKPSDNLQPLASKTNSLMSMFSEYDEGLSYKELLDKYKTTR